MTLAFLIVLALILAGGGPVAQPVLLNFIFYVIFTPLIATAIIFAGSLFVNFAQSANMIMRGEGILKKAMLITGTGAVLNIILDPIMITAMSAQGKGIEGAAYATVVSQIVTAAITLWYFLTKSKVVRIHRVRLESSLISEILGVGFSAMLMQVMTMVQQTTLYHVAARHGGDTWQIILGAALSIQSFTMIPLWGAGQGFQPAAGTNYGAKQYDRVKQVTRAFMVGVTVLSLIFYIPIQLAHRKAGICLSGRRPTGRQGFHKAAAAICLPGLTPPDNCPAPFHSCPSAHRPDRFLSRTDC